MYDNKLIRSLETEVSGFIWALIIIFFSKNEDSYIEIMLGVRFFRYFYNKLNLRAILRQFLNLFPYRG